jgi:hypothetical protein
MSTLQRSSFLWAAQPGRIRPTRAGSGSGRGASPWPTRGEQARAGFAHIAACLAANSRTIYSPQTTAHHLRSDACCQLINSFARVVPALQALPRGADVRPEGVPHPADEGRPVHG